MKKILCVLLWFCCFVAISDPLPFSIDDEALGIRYDLLEARDVDVDIKLPIISVLDGLHPAKAITEGDIDGLRIKYQRPELKDALGLSGIVLVGLELTERESGKRYWSFLEYKDQETFYTVPSRLDLYVWLHTDRFEKPRLTGWVVVYGHLMPDGKTIAVFDKRDSGVRNIQEFLLRNTNSQLIASSVDAAIDANYLSGRFIRTDR